MRRKWKRALSLLCTLAMIAGMLPVSSLAAAGQAQTVDGGINGYAAVMQADEVTSGGWRTAFVADGVSDAQQIDGTSRSSALNGKIWTDKSVEISTENPEQFNVTFSALGQTFGGQQAITKDVAFDVMFVLDVSGSMEDNDKDKAAVNAINGAMKAFLEGEGNEKNRVGITTFSESASLTLPLGHYTSSASDGDYLQYDEGGWGDNPGFSLTIQGRNGTVSFTGGTYTQSGIATGANALISGMNSVMDDTEHIPVLILITDGDPTYYCSDYDILMI